MKRRAYFLILGLALLACLLGNNAMAQYRGRLNEKITIQLSHVSADEVINAIRKQSAYNFLYDPAELKKVQIDEIKFSGASLGEVLDYLDRTKGLSFSS